MARKTTVRNDDDGEDAGDSGRVPGFNAPGFSSPGAVPSGEQKGLEDELRPSRLEDIVGQRAVVERLRILLEATKKRKEPLGHLLFDGPTGLG